MDATLSKSGLLFDKDKEDVIELRKRVEEISKENVFIGSESMSDEALEKMLQELTGMTGDWQTQEEDENDDDDDDDDNDDDHYEAMEKERIANEQN